jgi:DNA-binding NarL/FixJ family response regulator
MMLFANSNKRKIESIHEEMAAIQEAHHEIVNEPQTQDELFNLVEGLKSRLDSLHEEVDAILYKYGAINEMLHQVDLMISDYFKMDIEISSYELNGMEQDLLIVKDEYKQYNESIEDGVDKRKKLARLQLEIGRHVKRLVLLLKEEGYTTLEIATRLGISESTVRNLEG